MGTLAYKSILYGYMEPLGRGLVGVLGFGVQGLGKQTQIVRRNDIVQKRALSNVGIPY